MAIGEQRDQRREAEAAARFEVDPAMEQLVKWRDAGDRRYQDMPAGMKARLGFYLSDKAAARKAGKA